jgi:hypothetical protein
MTYHEIRYYRDQILILERTAYHLMNSQTEIVLEMFACSIRSQLEWLEDRNLQLVAVDVLNCSLKPGMLWTGWVGVKENSELLGKRDDTFLHF